MITWIRFILVPPAPDAITYIILCREIIPDFLALECSDVELLCAAMSNQRKKSEQRTYVQIQDWTQVRNRTYFISSWLTKTFYFCKYRSVGSGMHHWMEETRLFKGIIVDHCTHFPWRNQAKRYENWNLQQFEQWTGFRLLWWLTQPVAFGIGQSCNNLIQFYVML